MRPRWHRGSGAPFPARRCRIVATGGQRDGRQRVGADRSACLGGGARGRSVCFGLGGTARTAATRPRATIQVSAPTMWGRWQFHPVVRMSAYLVSGSAAAVWPMACWQSLLAEQPIGSRGICAATKNQRPRRLSYGQQRGYVVAIMHKRKAYPDPAIFSRGFRPFFFFRRDLSLPADRVRPAERLLRAPRAE